MNRSIIDNNKPNCKRYAPQAEIIRNERVNIGMSVEQLADHIGTTANAVFTWERGDQLPNGRNRASLAALFDINEQDILMGLSCIAKVESETPEQVDLTNHVLKQTVTESTYYGIPESEFNPDFFQNQIVSESDQEVEEKTGTYKDDDKPVFGLTFTGQSLTGITITQHCKTIAIQLGDLPTLLIEHIADVRGK